MARANVNKGAFMTGMEEGKRLRIYICERHRSGQHALHEVLLARAREAGLAGCVVFQGREGYGNLRHLEELHLLTCSRDLPLVVEVVDAVGKVGEYIEAVRPLLGNATITLEDVAMASLSRSRA